ncbi:family 16 glycosylhydrolase [Colwellia sp. UCD-KL20]|uniref:family 16 glycosylhydrolase n=1 Tax=Colwellia sp. UCD-KL20 TaxID=1917165 RepID=UPI0009713042|nr:family 16 glycosylhydrolase [Colwellia sp. UCD-KL20]
MKKLSLKKFTLCFGTLCLTTAMTGCQTTEAETVVSEATQSSVVMPASDQTNQGGWVLNQDVSDEFEGTKLDEDKWFIEGQHGDYYIWKGRAPSQFVPENVIVEDGKLKLRTKWEPDYDFIKESYADGGMGSAPYGKLKDGTPMPVTTAGVLTKKRFLHGYMEVKSKVGNAAITGAFWAIGYEQELDIYEQMGNPKNKKGNIREMNSLATAHDWSPPAQRPTNVFQHVEPLPFRTADEFHVYGAEWGVDFLKLFIDGRLVHHFTQDDVGTDWVLNNPMEIWLDSEIFHWLGYPHKEELPVDFEIEYLRVWQKPIDNLLAPAFFGFEGPILFEENPRPLTMVPEDSNNNDYQKFWDFDETSAKYLSIIEGDYATGVNSLELRQIDKNETVEVDKIRAVTPEGAIKLPAGDYILSMKVWADKGRVAKNVYINFEGQDIEVTFDEIDKLERRQWITLEKKVTFAKDSGAKDKLSIEIHKADLPKKRMGTRLRIDDIEMKAVK